MPGLVPGIHARRCGTCANERQRLGVDGRDKPGHDGGGFVEGAFLSRACDRVKRRDVAYDPPLAAAWAAARFFSIMRTA